MKTKVDKDIEKLKIEFEDKIRKSIASAKYIKSAKDDKQHIERWKSGSQDIVSLLREAEEILLKILKLGKSIDQFDLSLKNKLSKGKK